MPLVDGFPSASGVVSAQDLRLDLAGTVVRSSAGVPRYGVFLRSMTPIVSVRGDMKVDVAAFEAAVGRPGQGVILIASDGTDQVTIPSAPLANARYDVVWVKQNDSVAPNADANSLPVFGVSSSPVVASPSKAAALAAMPVGALALAALLIPSGVAATNAGTVVLSQEHPYTCMTGGSIPFRTTTERDAFAAGDSQECDVLADNSRFGWASGTWRRLFRTRIAEYQKGASPGAVLASPAYADTSPSVTVTATTQGGLVEVEFDAMVTYAGVGVNNLVIYYRVLLDGVPLGDESNQYLPAQSAGSVARLTISHTPTAGSHTWKIQMAASSVTAAVLGKARLVIIENP